MNGELSNLMARRLSKEKAENHLKVLNELRRLKIILDQIHSDDNIKLYGGLIFKFAECYADVGVDSYNRDGIKNLTDDAYKLYNLWVDVSGVITHGKVEIIDQRLDGVRLSLDSVVRVMSANEEKYQKYIGL